MKYCGYLQKLCVLSAHLALESWLKVMVTCELVQQVSPFTFDES